MSVDDQLLNVGQSKNGGADRAGEFREARRGAVLDSQEPQSLRQAVLEEKRKNILTASAKEKVEEKIAIPFSQSTAKLLKQAWIHLIDSFGLTLIWINVHVFLSKVLGEQLFCRLGEEWLPANPVSGALAGESAKSAARQAGTIEAMGCGCLDLVALLIILFVVGIIAMIGNVITNPLDNIKTIFGALWGFWTS